MSAFVTVFGSDCAVSLYLVRTRSKGERTSAETTAAAAATNSDAHGYGDAMSISRSMSFLTPISGTLNSALSKLRDQFSNSDCKTPYIKVALVPFQTPQADSLFHN